MLAMIAGLASELAVTRERLDTLERLLEAAGGIDRGDIEAFTPDALQTNERDAIRGRLIATIFAPLQQASETASKEG